MVDSEIQRINLISRTPELNYLLKYNVKKVTKEYNLEEKNGVFYEKYKKIEKQIDYLIIVNYWKKLLYADYGMRDKSFEIFNKDAKKLAFSKNEKKINETKDDDYRVLKTVDVKSGESSKYVSFGDFVDVYGGVQTFLYGRY